MKNIGDIQPLSESEMDAIARAASGPYPQMIFPFPILPEFAWRLWKTIERERAASDKLRGKTLNMNNEKTNFEEWALVELFGHQKIVGKVTEATMAGGAFLRVDVPAFDKSPAFTRFFSPGAIYSINPISEEIACGMMERYRNEPVSRFDLPQIAERVDDDDQGES